MYNEFQEVRLWAGALKGVASEISHNVVCHIIACERNEGKGTPQFYRQGLICCDDTSDFEMELIFRPTDDLIAQVVPLETIQTYYKVGHKLIFRRKGNR